MALYFSFSEIEGHHDNLPLRNQTAWSNFCAGFSHPDRRGDLSADQYHALDPSKSQDKLRRDTVKNGPAWLPSTFRKDGKRTNEDVTAIHAFVADCDNGSVTGQLIENKLSKLEYFAHTTYSHRPEKPKWRIIVPFSRPIPPSRLENVFDYFNVLFEGQLDPCGKKLAQLYYKSSCPPDGVFDCRRHSGELLAPEKIGKPVRKPVTEIPSASSPDSGEGTETPLPPACSDGHRHEVGLSAIGRWISEGRSRDEVLALARQWNATNIDRWPDEVLESKVNAIFKADQRKHPERYAARPWDGVECPDDYELKTEGVFLIPENDAKQPLKISGPAWVTARTRDIDSNCWGYQVEWLDSDSTHHDAAIPAQRFHEQGGALAQDLAADGLVIIPGKERQLTKYLGSFNPKKRFRSVSQLGWLDDPRGRLIYVLPKEVFGIDEDGGYVFQPERVQMITS